MASEVEAPIPFSGVHDLSKEDDGLIGLPVMTKAELQKVALEHGGYGTPRLNDTLYLHFKGYRRIENLEECCGLKALWLHSNGFGKIENLSHLHELRCLFLQTNALTKIENLHGLDSLVQLDLSENNIKCVEGLSHLPNLTTLNLSKNVLTDAESICHLEECKELSSVDLSKNQLSGEDIIDSLAGIAKVTSVNMEGNPVVSKVAYFRKKMIVACKSLRYLDRPIFDTEREATEAWAQGGIEAEREKKEMLQQAKKDKERKAIQEFRAWQDSVRSEAAPRYEVSGADEFMETATNAFDDDESLYPPSLSQPSEERQVIEILESEDEFVDALDTFDGDDSVILIKEPTPTGNESKANETIVKPILKNDDSLVTSQMMKSVSFIDPTSSPKVHEDAQIGDDPSTTPAPSFQDAKVDELPLAEIEKENIEPPSCANDDSRDFEPIEEAARRIRDSLIMLKSKQHNGMSGMITMGWTTEMEQKLLKLAKEYNYDWQAVASTMAEDHNSQHIMFDEESCLRRWNFLDLSAEDSTQQADDFVFPSTDKALSYFSNPDGQRKSIEEIRLGNGGNYPMVVPEALPAMDSCSSDDEGVMMHRGNLGVK